MSIWKSPIFYLSIVLMLLVSAALLAPFVVDWNSYRTDLERYGERLSGRAVRINGPISVKLFPFPQLQGERVSISTTDDPNSAVFAEADRVTVRVALAGLLAWQLRVEDISVDNPVINLVREADSRVNWIMLPQESLRTSRLLETVRLDRIFLNDGKVNYVDKSREGRLEIGVKIATFSAPAIEGPWRSSGTVSAYGLETDYTFNSSAVTKSGAPVKIGLKLNPKSKKLPGFTFDGSRADNRLLGTIYIEPETPTAEDKDKLAPATGLASFKAKATVEARTDRIEISNLQIVPANANDSSTLLEGRITADLGNRVTANAELKATRINLDALLGDPKSLADTHPLEMLNALLAGLPDTLDFSFVGDFATAKIHGETVEGIVIAGDLSQQALRLKRLSANLPGRSRFLADGTFFSGPQAGEYAGKVAFESNDLRQFATWKWPQLKSEIASLWTGSRGQFKLQSTVNAAAAGIRFSEAQFELDGQRGTADFAFASAAQPAIDAKIKISTLDVDNFIKRQGSNRPAVGASELATMAISLFGGTTASLTFNTDKLVLNGISASAVRIDGEVGDSGVAVRALDLSLLGDARVTAQGEVSLKENLPQGTFAAGVTAKDPLPLLQLVGAIQAADAPRWQRAVGATDATARLVFGHGESGPVANITGSGKSGPTRFETTLTVSDFAGREGMTYKGIFGATSEDDLTFLKLLGVDTPVSDKRAGQFTAVIDGNREAGFKLSVKAEMLTGRGSFEGLYKPAAGDVPQVEGALLISGDDTGALLRAIGVPLTQTTAGPFSASASLKPQIEALRFEDLKGVIAGEPFTGELDWKADRSFTSDLSIQSMTLPQLLAGVFLPWAGADVSLDSSFDGAPPFGIKGEFWLRPQTFQLIDGMPLSEAVVGVVIEGRERQATISARTAKGETVAAEAALLPSGGQFSVDMTVDLPAELKTLFTFADGRPQIDGTVRFKTKASGNGLTAGAVLADLSGDGTVSFKDVTILNFAPDAFATGIQSAVTSDQLRAGIAALQPEVSYSLADGDVPFKISLGRFVLQPILRNTDASTQFFDISADLQDRSLSAIAAVTVKNMKDLPPAKVLFEGKFGALRKRVETSAIAAKLGFAIMAREMEELERAQQEQQRIIEQEEAQRKLDVERFRAYQEQRAELRLRQRELRVHAVQRKLDADEMKRELEERVPELAAMTKVELARRARIMRTQQATANGAISKPVKSRRTFVVLDQIPDGFDFPITPEAPSASP
jgi:hypothetical protein